MGSLLGHFGVMFGSLWESLRGHVVVTLRSLLGSLWGHFGMFFGVTLGRLGITLGVILGSLWVTFSVSHFGKTLG